MILFLVGIVLTSVACSELEELHGLQYDYNGGYAAAYDNYQPHDYQYEYGVSDPHTGDHKSQWEVKDKGVVRGGYSLLEPDGTTRVVEYIADDDGFRAVVKKIGVAHHPTGVQVETHGFKDHEVAVSHQETPIIHAEVPQLSHDPIIVQEQIPTLIKSEAPLAYAAPISNEQILHQPQYELPATYSSYDGYYNNYASQPAVGASYSKAIEVPQVLLQNAYGNLGHQQLNVAVPKAAGLYAQQVAAPEIYNNYVPEGKLIGYPTAYNQQPLGLNVGYQQQIALAKAVQVPYQQQIEVTKNVAYPQAIQVELPRQYQEAIQVELPQQHHQAIQVALPHQHQQAIQVELPHQHQQIAIAKAIEIPQSYQHVLAQPKVHTSYQVHGLTGNPDDDSAYTNYGDSGYHQGSAPIYSSPSHY